MKPQRPIILVGGGTGGHIFPLVAVAEELEKLKIPFIFVGGNQSREEKIVQENNWEFIPITTGKWRRYFSIGAVVANIADFFRLLYGTFEATRLLLRTRATTVFSKGGGVSLAVVFAALLLRRRLVIHESDTVMGLTNRIAARFTTKILVAFDPSLFPNHDRRWIKVGIPIRHSLRQAALLSVPKKSRPLIFVLAGIQGSSAINQLIRGSLTTLVQIADIVHVTGEADYISYKAIAAKLPPKLKSAYKPFSFVGRELAYYYQSADLIVCRAGATSLAEAASFAKPIYLIPLPSAAGNHQLRNAQILEQEGAAILREEKTLSADIFAADLRELLNRSQQLQQLGDKLHTYFWNGNTIKEIINQLVPDVQTINDGK